MFLRIAALIAALLLVLPAFAADRVALVIGNGAYQSVDALPNPKNDATKIAAALEGIGFQVIVGTDLDRAGMEAKLRDYVDAAQDATLTVFYYAGHGIQIDGKNYLVPVDARVANATALDFELVRADTVLSYVAGPDRVALAFLDACRNNPLARQLARTLGSSRDVGDGLAVPVTRDPGLLISFATAADDTAADGSGDNSPFTTAVLSHITSPGLEIQEVLRRVGADVRTSTRGDQQPWTYGNLIDALYLVPGPDVQGGGQGTAEVSGTPPDEVIWDFIKTSNNRAVIAQFIGAYPNSARLAEAETLLASLPEEQRSMGFEPIDNGNTSTNNGNTSTGETKSGGPSVLTIDDLGVRVADLSATAKERISFDPNGPGVLILDVLPGGLAERFWFEAGDIVTSFNGSPVGSGKDLATLFDTARALAKSSRAATAMSRLSVIRDKTENQFDIDLGIAAVSESALLGLGLSQSSDGLRVEGVEGPAAESGLTFGYHISSVDERPVRSVEEFDQAIADARKAGRSEVVVKVAGTTILYRLPVLGAQTGTDAGYAETTEIPAPNDFGIKLVTMTPTLNNLLRRGEYDNGVLVDAVTPGSLAEMVGLYPGAIVVSLDGVYIDTPEEFASLVADAALMVQATKDKHFVLTLTIWENDGFNGTRDLKLDLGTEAYLEHLALGLKLSETPGGLLVEQVSGLGSRSGLKVGDLISEVDEERAGTIKDFDRIVRTQRGNGWDWANMRIFRDGKAEAIKLTLR